MEMNAAEMGQLKLQYSYFYMMRPDTQAIVLDQIKAEIGKRKGAEIVDQDDEEDEEEN